MVCLVTSYEGVPQPTAISLSGISVPAQLDQAQLESWITAHPQQAAEAFIADNIQKGLSILNDRQLSEGDRADRFQQLLLGLTDTRRIAAFTLGQYVRTAPQADQALQETLRQSEHLARERSPASSSPASN